MSGDDRSVKLIRSSARESEVFPSGSFSEDPDWDQIYRELYEQRLGVAGEPSFWAAEPVGERYRFLASEQFWGIVRVEAGPGTAELVAKRLTVEVVAAGASANWAVGEFRRPLTERELERFRGLIERAGFWSLPSRNDRFGLDGYHSLFEARVGGRYHLVDRWCPDRDGFARLCRFCESLYRAEAEPRRRWWFW
jgi:hypothetical protein